MVVSSSDTRLSYTTQNINKHQNHNEKFSIRKMRDPKKKKAVICWEAEDRSGGNDIFHVVIIRRKWNVNDLHPDPISVTDKSTWREKAYNAVQ